MAIDEVELCERKDPVAVERRLEREVEAGQRLDGGQTRHLPRRLDPAAFANGDLLGQQRLDRLDRTELTTLELLDYMLKRLQGARNAQADQVTADAIDRRSRCFASHATAPFAARCLPTAS